MKRLFSVFFILLFAMSFAAIAEEHVQAIQEGPAGKHTSPINALLKDTIDGSSAESVMTQRFWQVTKSMI
jgi:hypothetical protein